MPRPRLYGRHRSVKSYRGRCCTEETTYVASGPRRSAVLNPEPSQMRRSILTLFLGSTALAAAAVPATSQAQQAGSAECDRLVVALEKHAPPSPPVTLDQARGWQRDNDQQACRDANQRLAAAAPAAQGQPAAPGQEGNRIVVQEPAPTVRVEQAAPQVTVQQAQPQVTVRQRQPEILVRQPAPTVTVDIPQPEITVRMPPLEVSVAQAQPQVQVNQPQPQVQVVQPEKPQVQVQPAQPRVNVQQAANAQPDVQVEGGQQPQVRYERAEPKVVVNRAQGQPQVHVEQTQAGQEGTPPTAAPAPEQTAAVQPPAGRSEQPGRAAQAGAPAPVRVSQLLNM